MFGQIVHCVNDRFRSDMPHAIELISTERTGIPGLRLIVLSLLFLLDQIPTILKRGLNQTGFTAVYCSVFHRADRGKTEQIGLCGGHMNSPGRIGTFLGARHGIVWVRYFFK